MGDLHLWNRPAFETAAWFFGWPGLLPEDFFLKPQTAGQGRVVQNRLFKPVDVGATIAAVGKIVIGMILMFFIAPVFLERSPIISAWIGMAAFILTFHCGLIHLCAVSWNAARRPVKPIMNSPLLATSVSDFWSKRWNLAFRDYAHVVVFAPMSRAIGGRGAVIAGFLFSGFVHDLAISVPAGGGYGWPTLYFLIQAIGLLVERKLQKAGWPISQGLIGHCWTILWVVGPVGFLFHKPFVVNVILPIVSAASSVFNYGTL